MNFFFCFFFFFFFKQKTAYEMSLRDWSSDVCSSDLVRILMVTDFYPPFMGGVEVLVSTLSRELVARGHEVAVATLGAPGLAARELDGGARVHRIRASTQRTARLFATGARPWAPPAPDPEAVLGLRRV